MAWSALSEFSSPDRDLSWLCALNKRRKTNNKKHILKKKAPAPGFANENHMLFYAIEWVMLAWMFFELSINVYSLGGFFGPERDWNIFDVCVIVGSKIT